MKGILNVTGLSGVGKTSFASEGFARSPEKIAMITWDVKEYEGRDVIGYHASLAHILSDTSYTDPQIAMMEEAHKAFDALPDDLDILVLDAWEVFSKSLAAYVQVNHMKLKKVWFGMNGFWKTLEMRGHAHLYEAAILDSFQKKAKLVVVINHLKPQYNDKNEPTGLFVPDSSRSVIQKSACRIWLTPLEGKPYPAGLVIKNTSEKRFVSGVGMRTVSVLPPKLSYDVLDELGEYVSLWDVINYYYKNPIGNRKPNAYESMNHGEYQMVQSTLLEQIEQSNDEKEKVEAEALSNNPEIMEIVEKNKSKPAPLVYKKLKNGGFELTVSQVEVLLKKVGE
jgi:hypothetical protein